MRARLCLKYLFSVLPASCRHNRTIRARRSAGKMPAAPYASPPSTAADSPMGLRSGVREQQVPTLVPVKSGLSEERFIRFERPELPGAFETGLVGVEQR